MKRHLLFFVFLIFLTFPHTCNGQIQYSWQQFVEDYTADFSDNEDEVALQEELDYLETLQQSPLNLNDVTQEELQQLPFLNSKQIDDIINYRDKHQPLFGTEELLLIPSLSHRTRQYLSLFLVCKPTKKEKVDFLHQLLKGRHEITTRIDIPLYTRDGYKNNSDLSQSRKYLGDKLYTILRYRYNNSDTLKYGFTAEKDAGEPFASRGNSLYDSYSFYFFLQPKHARYVFALGDYRIHFGEGLIIGNGFMAGRTSALSMSTSPIQSIKPHTGVSESDFFRGVAGAFRIKKFAFTLSGAYTPKDAILRGDSVISSFKTDGYHRTKSEQSNRYNVYNLSFGADINWNTKHIKLGVSGLTAHYNYEISPSNKIYNKYALRGKSVQVGSLHYNISILPSLKTLGEMALSTGGGTAYLNTLRYYPLQGIQLISIQRYYGIRFHSPFGYAFKAGSKIQNERGVYLGFDANLNKQWEIRGFSDFFYFPWATYKYPRSAHGQAYMSEISFHPQAFCNFLVQYQFQKNQYKSSENEHLHPYRHSIRLSAVYSPRFLTLQTNIYGTFVKQKDNNPSKGFLISQKLGYNKRNWHITGLFAYFHTEDYNSRIYQYTPNVVYAHSFSQFYGNGIHGDLVGRAHITNFCELSLRYSITHYFDRSYISSGAERIASSSKNDLTIQGRFYF